MRRPDRWSTPLLLLAAEPLEGARDEDPAAEDEDSVRLLDPPAEVEDVPAVPLLDAAVLEDGITAEEDPPMLLALRLVPEEARELLVVVAVDEDCRDEEPVVVDEAAVCEEAPPEPDELDEDVLELASPSPLVEQPARTSNAARTARAPKWLMTSTPREQRHHTLDTAGRTKEKQIPKRIPACWTWFFDLAERAWGGAVARPVVAVDFC